MIRSPLTRAGLLLLLATGAVFVVGTVVAGLLLTADTDDAVLLAPTALAAFALVSLLAPLAAGGGNELYPPEQLQPFPVTAHTQYAASLLLAPLNLAWFSQLAGLFGLFAFILGDLDWGLLPAFTTLAVFIVLVTVLGQALAWVLVGARRTRRGAAAVWIVVGSIGAATAVGAGRVGVTGVLDILPTTQVVIALSLGYDSPSAEWAATTAVLLLGCLVAYPLGRAACAWALRRPGEAGLDGSRTIHRRRPSGPVATMLAAADRASVWRSKALRRGLYVLLLLPGGVVALAGLDWASLVLLPGLVAAGAGLLFGVNAFCLDGGGATWLAAQPLDPRLAFWSKTRVLAETSGLTVGVAVVVGALFAGGPPTAQALLAALGAAVASTALVVASCMRLSVHRPHRADLRSSRDTPAPPGSMAAYSLRLAVLTTCTGIAFEALLIMGGAAGAALLALALVLVAVRRLLITAREYADPVVRARVTAVVAAG